MECLPENLTVRKVTGHDFEKVMAIRPYGEKPLGMYLEDYFPHIIHSPNNEAYAVEKENKLIAFSFLSYVDERRTVVSRGLRVSPEFEGIGVASYLIRYIDNILKKRGDVIYKASLGDSKPTGLTKQIEMGTYRHIVTRDICHCLTDSQLLQTKFRNMYSDTVLEKRIDQHTLEQILCSPEMSTTLFKGGRVIVDLVPYRPMKSNAKLIMGERTTVVGSYLNDVEKALISFSNYFNHPTGVYMHVDIYGCIGNVFDEHIGIHVKDLLQYESNNIVLKLFCKEHIQWDMVCSVMQKYSNEIQFTWPSRLLCGEKTI